MTVAALICLSAGAASAQKLSIGVIGGLYLTDDFRSRPDLSFTALDPPRTFGLTRTSTSFTPRIGPKIELDFNEEWSLETDILFHRPVWTSTARYDPPIVTYPDGPAVAVQEERFDDSILEIPVLLKRRLRVFGAPVTLGAGPAFVPFGGFDGPGKVGVAASLGTEFRVGRVRFQPQLRYSRWALSPHEKAYGYGSPPIRRDMLSVLVGADIPAASLGDSGRPSDALSVGFIGGTTLTKDFPDARGFEGVTSRMAGVALEYHFRPQWSVEADAIYHPLVLTERARATVLTWELPVLLKRRFGSGALRPIVFAGPAFRLSGNRNSSAPSSIGAEAGAGVELRRGRWSVSPTLRYIRWAKDEPGQFHPGLSRQDQVQALVAISFGGR
ncbi:MAG: outer membrane beta-barrel protein [Bryobacterales bacterium]|nr:outer membrane beta-barrel protein [Bryobacterales bacterium]